MLIIGLKDSVLFRKDVFKMIKMNYNVKDSVIFSLCGKIKGVGTGRFKEEADYKEFEIIWPSGTEWVDAKRIKYNGENTWKIKR
jgi:hypothetical protein